MDHRLSHSSGKFNDFQNNFSFFIKLGSITATLVLLLVVGVYSRYHGRKHATANSLSLSAISSENGVNDAEEEEEDKEEDNYLGQEEAKVYSEDDELNITSKPENLLNNKPPSSSNQRLPSQHQKRQQASQMNNSEETSSTIPLLNIRNLLQDSTPPYVLPNTRFEIKSPLIEGQCVIAFRLPSSSSSSSSGSTNFQHLFQNKKRVFEFHVQLRFKAAPQGPLYIGGALEHQMKLGIIGDFICKTLLKIIRGMSKGLHYSFGSGNNKGLVPYIVFPLFYAAERLVITPPGCTPPLIGTSTPLPESDEERMIRFNDASLGADSIKKDCVLTFSFHSAYLDLMEWKVKNLGAIKDQPLKAFWDTQPLRLILYTMQPPQPQHYEAGKVFYLNFELENTGKKTAPPSPNEAGDSEEEAGLEEGVKPPLAQDSVLNENAAAVETADGKPSKEQAPLVNQSPRIKSSRVILKSLMKNVLKNNNNKVVEVKKFESLSCMVVGLQGEDLVMVKCENNRNYLLGNAFDFFNNNGGKVYKRKGFHFEFEKHEIEQHLLGKKKNGGVLMHSSNNGLFSLVADVLGAGRGMDYYCLRNVNESKWQLEQVSMVTQQQPGGLLQLIGADNGNNQEVISFVRKSNTALVGTTTIPVSSIRSVKKNETKIPYFDLESEACVLLEIETLLKVTFLIMKKSRGEEFYASLVGKIQTVGYHSNLLLTPPPPPSLEDNNVEDDNLLLGFSSLDETCDVLQNKRFFHTPRVVLNSRRVCFSRTDDSITPYEVGSSVLRHVITLERLSNRMKKTTPNAMRQLEVELVSFFEHCEMFKRVNLNHYLTIWSNEEAQSFFLNLFHCILHHAKILLGFPTTGWGWGSFVNTTCYEIGCFENTFQFSLAEIEHRLLRAHPPRLWLNFPLPNPATHTMFTLRVVNSFKRMDERVNFALNYGTLSSCSKIHVFFPPLVFEEALDSAARNYLNEFLVVDTKKRLISLPRIVYWYYEDFTNELSTKSILLSILKHYEKWLSMEKLNVLKTLLPNLDEFINNNNNNGGSSSSNVFPSPQNQPIKFFIQNWSWKERPVGKLEIAI